MNDIFDERLIPTIMKFDGVLNVERTGTRTKMFKIFISNNAASICTIAKTFLHEGHTKWAVSIEHDETSPIPRDLVITIGLDTEREHMDNEAVEIEVIYKTNCLKTDMEFYHLGKKQQGG